jgi:hypothetical protein
VDALKSRAGKQTSQPFRVGERERELENVSLLRKIAATACPGATWRPDPKPVLIAVPSSASDFADRQNCYNATIMTCRRCATIVLSNPYIGPYDASATFQKLVHCCAQSIEPRSRRIIGQDVREGVCSAGPT